MKKILMVAVSSALLFSSASFAAKTGPRDVLEVSVSANQKVTVKLSGAATNPAGCTQSVYVIEGGDAARKDMLAQLLTARAMGAKVDLAINDTLCVNSGKNPKISTVTIK